MTIDAAAIVLLALATLVGLVALVLLVMAAQIKLPPKDKGKARKP
jgi:hypothetical protein